MAGDDLLADRVGRALVARAARLAVAESCTGGLVGSRITGVPGSSRYLLGGVVAYHNSAKVALLRVPRATLTRCGAVSAPVAAAMARGARRVFRAEIAVAVTGIAGPGGGSPGKPVGLVYVAVSGFGRTRCRSALFGGDRRRVRDRAADLALIMLLEHLEEVSQLAQRAVFPHLAGSRPPRGSGGGPAGTPASRRVFPAGSNCSMVMTTNPPERSRRGR